MEVIRCPNPKCRRCIWDDEGTETEWTVLEIKCQHCGKLVRLHFGPDGIEAGIYERKNGGGDSVAVLAERRISLTENAVEKRGI